MIKNRSISLLLLIGIVLFFILFYLYHINIPCLFQSLFSLPCPGCGLTRAFRLLFDFQIKQAVYTNILVIPLFLGVIASIPWLIYDIFRGKNSCFTFVFSIFQRFWKEIISILLLSLIWNIIHGI